MVILTIEEMFRNTRLLGQLNQSDNVSTSRQTIWDENFNCIKSLAQFSYFWKFGCFPRFMSLKPFFF